MPRKTKGYATLAEVAELAGVSPITASRALRGLENVRPDTRVRVEEAAEKIGYTPDPMARSLANGRSDVIGVLVPSVTNAVFSDVLLGLYEAADGTGMTIQIGNTRYDPEEECRLVKTFAAQRPAGMIVAGTDQTPKVVDLLSNMNCPVVQVMDISGQIIDKAVGLDHRAAAAAGARHLKAQGYKRPVFMAAQMDPRSKSRIRGFRDVWGEEAGLVADPAPSSIALGRQMMAQVIQRFPEADAVQCNNDDIALGVVFELLELGVDMPGKMGVCGFNDLEYCQAANPAMTSVRTPRYEMGVKAIELLLGQVDGDVLDLGFEVMARSSTARSR
ncbi:LacI family DNA-binding transcriptional regulator [Paracoccaceae bacterium GXU_MW_L88]